MAKPTEGYDWVDVESYVADQTSGLHGEVHIRPITGGPFPTDLRVAKSKLLVDTTRYPVGTRFRIWAKLTDRKGGGEYLYTSWQWDYEVLSKPETARR